MDQLFEQLEISGCVNLIEKGYYLTKIGIEQAKKLLLESKDAEILLIRLYMIHILDDIHKGIENARIR